MYDVYDAKTKISEIKIKQLYVHLVKKFFKQPLFYFITTLIRSNLREQAGQDKG